MKNDAYLCPPHIVVAVFLIEEAWKLSDVEKEMTPGFFKSCPKGKNFKKFTSSKWQNTKEGIFYINLPKR